MVFSSLEFLFLFLPCTLFVYYFCIYLKKAQIALASLFIASLFYYAYWNPSNLWIILASIVWNFSFGLGLLHTKAFTRKFLFILGLLGNVFALAYFKYTDFAINIINDLMNADITLTGIVLPIGISFFTFQQIAYLVDAYAKPPKKEQLSFHKQNISFASYFLDYCLFVCFFPQLVAGPIVHHSEMMPQFANEENQKINWENIYWGLVLLSIGLAKKVLIADNISPLVIETFENAPSLKFTEALIASLAYTFQLYYDFSGYSDMAVGIALFFNIKLPFNFFSPYKAVNIQDFWRRWHITLSRWLREYIYIPLGGNQKGKNRTFINLFLTFLLGGLWHGAAWTFVLWGAFHGLAIIIHRLWVKSGRKMHTIPAIFCTFLFVNFTWILFRAPNFERVKVFFDALRFDKGAGVHHGFFNIIHDRQWAILGIACILCFAVKNSKEFYNKGKASTLLSIFVFLSFISITFWLLYTKFITSVDHGEFIYFQF